jgi:hypothetical protein
MKKRHLKQRLKNLGVCKTCAPMLRYKPTAGATIAEINCPACGRVIKFDFGSDEAVNRLLSCLGEGGDFCTKGMRGVLNGKVVRECNCDCPKPHLSLDAKSVSETATALEV